MTFRFQEITGLFEAKARNKQETAPTDRRVPAQPSANVSKHALHLRLPAKPIHAGISLFVSQLKGNCSKQSSITCPTDWAGTKDTLTGAFRSVYTSLVCEKCHFESHKNTTVTTMCVAFVPLYNYKPADGNICTFSSQFVYLLWFPRYIQLFKCLGGVVFH